METMTDSQTMTPAQFARATGLSLGYVYGQIWSGRVQAEKIDGVWAIPESELDKREQSA